MRPQTIADSPAVDSTAPTRSSRGEEGSRDSGTSITAPSSASATMGMLTRKTLFQSKCSSSQPPVIGPAAMPSPETPAQIAMAFGRSCAGKMFVRIESVVGMIAAAPRPISPRDAISSVADPDSAASAEPAAKMTRPVISARLRPKRSPRLPAVISRPAKTSRYASTIHCSWLEPASSSARIVGSATLRIVLPTVTTNRLSARTTSACQRRE